MMKKWLLTLSFLMIKIAALQAQGCSVCTKTAAELGRKSANGLNDGIVYLAAFPLIALGSIGFIWWRKNRETEKKN
jgi:hypothetical protein